MRVDILLFNLRIVMGNQIASSYGGKKKIGYPNYR